MLEKFGHGGDLLTAAGLYGLEAGQFVDFSANMNPHGPPDAVRAVLQRYAETIGSYPDPAVRGLRRKLALHHGVEEGSVLVGNGAAELIDLVVRLLLPSEVILAQPCFVEYGDAARKCGIPIRTVALAAEERFALTEQAVRHTMANMRDQGIATGTALWFLGSPNNPTGQLIDAGVIRLLLAEGERVVLDEAFMDFVAEEKAYSFISEAASGYGDRLIVIRSMTKFYAIPGIRLGYMVADEALIAGLSELQVPWSVNSLAQQIGEAVLDDISYAERTMAWLKEERPWLTQQLEQLGLDVAPGHVNYVLFRIPRSFNLKASELQQLMGERGVLIRDASHFEGLGEGYCRIAVRFRQEHELLLQTLREVLAGRKAGGR
ncbi:threonine-phosphate decarboxylase [Paenibacillus phyllosphaerae]|uniref:threonine-phosphate decarboxylase n=1 Tax=Paenibacillus phyllosphaerae TaxID=274593 RepID=A0A7W5AVN0_9BACL|nr:threonine-phosphate decarboxylase [Paenibacillus phyllosphaerae]